MKILIAEDDYVSRLLVKKAIKNIGHDVVEAENGKIAWERFLETLPDMVISDWMMPEMDGIELCRRIRASDKKTYSYIILLTAKDKMTDLVEVFEAGADDYIIKPFKPDELRSRIKTGERIVTLESQHHHMQEKLIEKNNSLDQALAELKISQSQILQSEKMASIGQLAAGVAHEINNPIGFVGSNLDALNDYIQDVDALLEQYLDLTTSLHEKGFDSLNEEHKKKVKAILEKQREVEIDYIREDIPELIKDCKEGTSRVGKIVGDLKSFAHPGNDRQTLVDINKGLESTLNVVHNELKYKTTVIKELGDIPMVEGFPQKLNQVFMNILVNAGQAIEEKGEIRIQTRAEGKNVVILISDTGCGIAPENLPKIFDPFFTTKEIGKGTGLGMNIAYNIIEEHKGKITIDSAVGKGTTFTVVLPGK
ncbi:MAG: response regulator [Proteobacteria bacterium]|nr:response regulator [Pseudomonadota bacterium]MBU1386513.1 response regulator [Pseudomonadota bacterium]MBU1544624.1 response regulator [Pseudomonadota bacterium]MBU2481397.1 response regulator [Pseudomonadota bacterium]